MYVCVYLCADRICITLNDMGMKVTDRLMDKEHILSNYFRDDCRKAKQKMCNVKCCFAMAEQSNWELCCKISE